MKKTGLTALGVAGACAACCAIPLAIPILGSLSISGLSLLAVDQFLPGPVATALAATVGLGIVAWAGAWYVAQRRKRSAMAQSGIACSVPSGTSGSGCGCAKDVP